ncbi:hypothetical protein M0R45_034829 [Rubus argutus]|uniref:Uncharacterized protein n=1 Tax=Rubus argutus TaxID=59490 RepID=A0AAW1VS56_RUBAR
MACSCLCYRSLSTGSSSRSYTGFFGRRSKTRYQCMASYVVVIVGMRGLGKNVDFTSWTLWYTSWRFCCTKPDLRRLRCLRLLPQARCLDPIYNMCTKNQLQHYAQKRNLILPVYSCEWECPPDASRFKCTVTIKRTDLSGSRFSSHNEGC